MEHLQEVLIFLQKNELYTNLKKCSFMIDRLVFLGYVMSSEGIHVDKGKVKAIHD